MQLRNFCLNRTTSERFGKAKVVQESRTSSYLEDSQSGSTFIDDEVLGQSIVEAMQTRDHSYRKCPVLHNCADMCCLSEHPDQSKIYDIQAKKQAKTIEEYEALLRRSQEVDNPNASHKTYEKTPKISKASKVDREQQEHQAEIVEEGRNSTVGNSQNTWL